LLSDSAARKTVEPAGPQASNADGPQHDLTPVDALAASIGRQRSGAGQLF